MEGGWDKYEPTPRDAGRIMVIQGCDYKIERSRVKEYLTEDAMERIAFYWRWKTLGWPYLGGWAEQPADLADIAFLLDAENSKRIAASGRYG